MGLAAQQTLPASRSRLFGSVEAGQAILSLTSDGGAAFSSVLGEMGMKGVQAAFETMDSGLSANFDRIKANLAVLAIDIGEKLAPHVARATDFLVDLFDRLGPFIEKAKVAVQEWGAVFIEKITPAVERFVEVAKRVIDWVRTFIKENPKAALAALGVIVASVVIPAVLGLVAAFAALFSPVIFIVAALAALAAGAVYAYEHFEGFRNVVDTVRDWMVNTLWPAQVGGREDRRRLPGDGSYFQTDFLTHVQAVVDAIKAWQAVANFYLPAAGLVLGYIDGQGVGHLLPDQLPQPRPGCGQRPRYCLADGGHFLHDLPVARHQAGPRLHRRWLQRLGHLLPDQLPQPRPGRRQRTHRCIPGGVGLHRGVVHPVPRNGRSAITTIFTTLADFFTVWPIKAAFEGIRSSSSGSGISSMVSLVKACSPETSNRSGSNCGT